jgi:RHS repeat-associated protein
MSLPAYYLYNANNQRTAKLINNEIAEKYLWLNLTTLLAIYDKDNNLISRFYYADDRVPYKVKHNNQIYYLSYNHQGSLKQITDTNGQNIKSVIYSVYGNIINDTDPNLNIPIGFAGGLYDKDTKLTKFGYRDYDSEIGKWITKDPIDFNGGDSNLYGYVLNDPVNFVDPTGLQEGLNLFPWYYLFDSLGGHNAINNNKDFTVIGHGGVGYIEDGSNGKIYGVNNINELAEKMRNNGYKDGESANLLSCKAGAIDPSTNMSLAQSLANEIQGTVRATDEDYIFYTFFPSLNRPAKGHQILPFTPK